MQLFDSQIVDQVTRITKTSILLGVAQSLCSQPSVLFLKCCSFGEWGVQGFSFGEWGVRGFSDRFPIYMRPNTYPKSYMPLYSSSLCVTCWGFSRDIIFSPSSFDYWNKMSHENLQFPSLSLGLLGESFWFFSSIPYSFYISSILFSLSQKPFNRKIQSLFISLA